MEGGGDDPSKMRKWCSVQADVRHDPTIMSEAMEFIEEFGVMSVAMPDRIIDSLRWPTSWSRR